MNDHLIDGKLYFKTQDGVYHELGQVQEINDDKLYFKTSNGVYHKIGEIQEIKESIIKADDEYRANGNAVPSKNYSLKRLSEEGYFDKEINFDLIINGNNENLLKLLKGIEESYNLMIRYNLALIDSYWVVEFAKRYILEHCKDALKFDLQKYYRVHPFEKEKENEEKPLTPSERKKKEKLNEQES